MAIQDSWRKFADTLQGRKFASGTSLRPTQQELRKEVGVSAQSFIGTYGQEELKKDKRTAADYARMRSNDGTASALYNILTLPVLANPYSIIADETDTDEVQAQFVRDNFELPPHKGGMSTPFNLVLADMLRAVLEGFRLFEKVYDIKDGKIVYRKIASRDNTTVTLLTDDNGGFDGATQRAWTGSGYKEVRIPKEKCFLYTFGKDKDFLYGESAFRAGYYHYDKAHKLYYLANLGIQTSAIPPKKLMIPADGIDATERARAERAADQLGVRSRITLPAGWDLDQLDTTKGAKDPLGLIEHHKNEMARSVLAQFLMLGTGGSTGSWALSKDQSDVFVMALKGLMGSIEDHINSYLIPDLITFNFAQTKYPMFKFQDMSDETSSLLQNAFSKLVEKQAIPEWLAVEISNRVAESLDIEKPEGASDQSAQPAPVNNADLADVPGTNIQPGYDPNQPDSVQKVWRRDITKAEGKVKFADLEKKMTQFEQDILEAVKPVWEQIRSDAMNRLTPILEKKDLKALGDFSLKAYDYEKILRDKMREAYEYAKVQTSYEIKTTTPSTNKDTLAFISQNCAAVAQKQLNDLLFIIKSTALAELRKNTLAETQLGVGDILSAMANAFNMFYDKKITLTGTIAVAQAINRGRTDVFESRRKEIRSYQYSAILDRSTCELCETLDGTVVDYGAWSSSQYEPPIHENCRCIWVAIMNDEVDPPDETGFDTDALNSLKAEPSLGDVTTEHLRVLDNTIAELDDVRRELEARSKKQAEIDRKLAELDIDE